jgi:hypothetical protein
MRQIEVFTLGFWASPVWLFGSGDVIFEESIVTYHWAEKCEERVNKTQHDDFISAHTA